MSSYICAEDYLDSATRTVSSEDSVFTASNLYDQSIRGRVWRSAGFFEVTSANKTIIFRETVLVDLTANIVEGTYDNLTSFLTAVKTALEAAGASTYTVTQNTSSKKIVITSDGLGGGGVFQLRWTDVLSTAADLLGFSTAADDQGALTYTADTVRIHSYEWLKWDLGASSNPDIFIAIGKKNQAIKISNSATIRLQGNATDVWTSPSYDQALTYDENTIYKTKTIGQDGLHPSALRYWRLKITDRDNVNGYVELSNVYLGEYYSTTQGAITFPFTVTNLDFSSSTQFQSGAKSYTRRQRGEAFSFAWQALTTTEKEQFDTFARDLGESKPFYMVFDPNLYFGSSVNYNIRYVRFANPPAVTLEDANLWSSSWSLEEVI